MEFSQIVKGKGVKVFALLKDTLNTDLPCISYIKTNVCAMCIDFILYCKGKLSLQVYISHAIGLFLIVNLTVLEYFTILDERKKSYFSFNTH